MKNCKVCGKVSKDDLCSKDCKRVFNNRIEDALNVHAPRIKGRGLTPNEIKMQEEFIKKNGIKVA